MKKLQKIWYDYEKWILLIGVILFLSIFSGFYYYRTVQKNVNGNVTIINTLTDNTPPFEVPIDGNVTQIFKATENFNGFQIQFAAIGGTADDRITVRIMEQASGLILQEWTKSYIDLQEIKAYDFLLNHEVSINQKTPYTIEIENTNKSGTGTVYLYSAKSKYYYDGETYVNGQSRVNDIVFNVYQKQDEAYAFITPLYVFLAVSGIAAVAFLVLALFFRKWKIEKVFLVVTFIMGILYMVILPPFSSPDEPIHFGTSYKISNWMMGMPISGEHGVVAMRESDGNVEYDTIPSIKTYQYTMEHMFEKNNDTQTVEWKHMDLGIRNKFSHLPGALGITLARALELGSVPLIYLGRLANLLFYVITMYFAIKMTPIGKTFFFAFSLSPMMLELISSYSYDCVINGLACLSIAMILHCMFKAEKVTWREMILLLVLAAVLAPCKIVYSLIFGLVLLIPKEKFEKKWMYYCFAGAVAVAMVVGILYVNLEKVLIIGGISTSPVAPTVPVAPSGYSLAWCMEHPLELCQIYWNTLLTCWKSYFFTMFGGRLGWLEIEITPYVIFIVAILTTLTLFLGNDITQKIKIKHRITSVVIVIMVSMLILLSMFLASTWYGSDVIGGVQGRYFLTIFPLALLIVGNKKVKLKANWGKYILLCLLMVNVYTVFEIFAKVSGR